MWCTKAAGRWGGRVCWGKTGLVWPPVHGLAVGGRPQAALGDQHSARGEQSHLEKVPPAGQPGGNQLAPVLRGGEHLPIPCTRNLFAEHVVIHRGPSLFPRVTTAGE